jgi:hypothetical protein
MHSTNQFGEFAHRTPFRQCKAQWPKDFQTPILELMDRLFDFLVPAALLAVLLALSGGLYALFRGGDFGRSNSNKLMRLRVVLQFLAIIVLVAAYWWRTR